MKKTIILLGLVFTSFFAQSQEKFIVNDLGEFKLHSFITGDPLGDINYLIETKEGIVVLEPVPFYEDIKLINDYILKIGKPLVKVIADYHIAGFSGFDSSLFVTIDGMIKFSKEPIYGNMIENFANIFKDKFDVTHYNQTEIISKNAKVNWAGIDFQFAPGTSSDFPASSIIIGGKVYYTHFTPSKAHPSVLQIYNRDAVNAVLLELEKIKTSGCRIIIGGHGIATTDFATVEFEINYLKEINKLLVSEKTKESFIKAIMKLYPNLKGDINALADALYK